MMNQKVKIAITGFQNGHCPALFLAMKSEPDVEVVAVSFAPHAFAEMETRMGPHAFDGIDIFYDQQEMLDAHPEIEACICGGSNNRHAEEFRLCAERGIHVISMKAPTYDSEEYDEMIRLAKQHNILVFIELEMRWKASLHRIRDILASGALGEIESFCAYNYSHNPIWWNHWMDVPEESYGKRLPLKPNGHLFRGGALTDHPHIFDVTRYLFDCDFESVYAEAAPNMRVGTETEDLVYVIGRLTNGVIFSLDPSYANREIPHPRAKTKEYYTWLSNYPRPVQVELQVTGSKGTLYCDAYGADYIEYMLPDSQKYAVTPESFLAIDNQRRLFIREFIADIRKHTTHDNHALIDHKKTIMAMNAAYDSIYDGTPKNV